MPMQESNAELSEKSGMLQAEKRILEEDIKRWKARTQVAQRQKKNNTPPPKTLKLRVDFLKVMIPSLNDAFLVTHKVSQMSVNLSIEFGFET